VARIGFGGVFGGLMNIFQKIYAFISIFYLSYSNKTFAPFDSLRKSREVQ
jgi:hypothetical protein